MALWLVALAVAVVFLGASELAYRAGRSKRGALDDGMRGQLVTLQAGSLGLLALILGFSMSMADARFSARRVILIDEANAIGTTYLRTSFLTEPEGAQSRALLRDYVDARRDYFRASVDEAPVATARAQAIHAELWSRVTAVALAHPDWDVLSTYIDSLNHTIDLEASRDLALAVRVPPTIYLLLLMVAVVAVGLTGYATGVVGTRTVVSLYVVPLLIALACGLIIDLDRSRAGLISTTDRPMIRLQQLLKGERAATLE